MTESLSSHATEPGRIARDATQTNQTGWIRWLPGLNTLRHYEVALAAARPCGRPRHDDHARAGRHRVRRGIGVPGINGLYATIVPLLAYALFGPSRILVLGPDSALAPVILTVVLPLSAGEPQRAVALAGMMAIVSGVVCVAAGLARLGFITELLSKPIRYGYMNGIALTVLLSQVPKLLGFSVTANGPVRQAWGIFDKVLAREHEPHGTRDRRQHARSHTVTEALAARTRHFDRRGRRHRRRRGLRPRKTCRHICARSSASRDCPRHTFLLSTSTTWYRSSRVASRSPSFHSRTRACFLEPMRRVCAHRSTRTRRWWASASPTSPQPSFRASPSAAAHRAHRWPRRRAPGPS